MRKKTHQEYEEQILERELELFPIEQYINSRTKITHECFQGHRWLVRPSDIIDGHGCPYCADTRYNAERPATVYYVKIEKDDKVYYKIGITSSSIKERFSAETDKIITILWHKNFDKGKDALSFEQKVLYDFKKDRVIAHNFLRSKGNTELFKKDILWNLI